MSVRLIDRLKRVFGALPLPPEIRARLVGASTVREGIERLDELITANEVEFRELQKDLVELERVIEEEKKQAGSEHLGLRSARVAGLRLNQLERHADLLEERLRIHDANLRLQVALLGKLQAIDAMELRGLDERQVDEVAVDFEEELKKHLSVIEAGLPLSPSLDEAESGEASLRQPAQGPSAARSDRAAQSDGGEAERAGEPSVLSDDSGGTETRPRAPVARPLEEEG